MFIRLIQAWHFLKDLDDGRTAFYVRHPSVAELALLLRFGRRNIVLELNGVYKLEIETRSLKGRSRLLMDHLLDCRGFMKAKGAVSVTREIGAMHPLDRYHVPYRTVITNGINVDDYAMRVPFLEKTSKIKLLAVANFNRWHGYDRMLKALKGSDPTKVELHFVGDGPKKESLVRLASELGVRNAFSHPPLKGKELDRMFDECDAALGVLGLSRKGLKEMSPLKHREYYARGIPFIYSGHDLDIPEDAPFTLRLVEDEEISLCRIIEFALRMRERSSHPAEMREFASKNLDWKVKARELSDFFRSVLAGS